MPGVVVLWQFDSGPSLWNGMSTPPYNPLREVLDILGEGDSVKYAKYDGWGMHVPVSRQTGRQAAAGGRTDPLGDSRRAAAGAVVRTRRAASSSWWARAGSSGCWRRSGGRTP